jgi:predicted dehydrogenase
MLAGAAPLLGACRTLGDSRPIPRAAPRAPLGPNDPVRMAVIGTGGMGTAHCDAFARLAKDGKANVQVVALCDVCDPRLDNAKKKLDEKQPGVAVDTYRDHHELLARDDIHGVLIATPEHWHAPMVEDAVAAGKDAYVEKPMTLRLDGALRLLEVTKANPDMIVQVGTQYITEGKYGVVSELIANGEIGIPTFSQTSYCRNSKDGEWNYYGIDESWEPGVNLDWERWCGPLGVEPWDPKIYARWRRYRKYSTGIIGDLLVHMMTPMILAVDQGWPKRVVASGGHLVDKDMENHDQVNIGIEFETGHVMEVVGSTCNERGLEIMVRGHEATLFLGGKDVAVRPERIYADVVDPREVVCEAVPEHDLIRLDWLNSIRTREPNLSPVELGARVMVIVDLATRSLWEGSAFVFDRESMTARAI